MENRSDEPLMLRMATKMMKHGSGISQCLKLRFGFGGWNYGCSKNQEEKKDSLPMEDVHVPMDNSQMWTAKGASPSSTK